MIFDGIRTMSQLNRRDFIKSSAILSAANLVSGNGHTHQYKQPNILFFFPDQHRYDWVGSNPDIPVNTPVLDALEKRGVSFTQAVCPSPVCAPSRACLALGVEYDNCPVPNNGYNLPTDQPTLYSRLQDAGYHVMGCGKFDLHKATSNWGIDGQHLLPEWGFSAGVDNAGKWDAYNSGKESPKDPYMYYLHQNGLAKTHIDDFSNRRGKGNFTATFPTPLPDHAYCDNWIAHNGISLLRAAPQNKPWFIQVNFAGPHSPVDITKSMVPWYEGQPFPQPNQNTQYDEAQHHKIRQNYSAMVEDIDRWFGYFIEEVKKRGEWENTIIVFSSDHGEMLGDHNLWAKTQPYQPSVGVPLVIAGPGINQNKTVTAPATTLDLAASFLDYAGANPLPGKDSKSLRTVLSGDSDQNREYVLSGLHNWRMVNDGQYKLITGYSKSGEPILFNRKEDPLENNNIASKAPDVVKRLQKLLLS